MKLQDFFTDFWFCHCCLFLEWRRSPSCWHIWNGIHREWRVVVLFWILTGRLTRRAEGNIPFFVCFFFKNTQIHIKHFFIYFSRSSLFSAQKRINPVILEQIFLCIQTASFFFCPAWVPPASLSGGVSRWTREPWTLYNNARRGQAVCRACGVSGEDPKICPNFGLDP